MSVTTTADEAVTRIKESILDIMSNIRNATDPDTWGSSDFNDEFVDDLNQLYITLSKFRRTYP